MPRSRSAREDSPHRKPFSASPSPRSKYSFPVVNTPVLRKARHNSENQPPEIPLNVKVNSPFSETYGSPALHSSKPMSAKGKHHGSLSLPPRPPPPRPSPSTNAVKNGHDAQGNVKRKLNLESPVCADVPASCSSLHESDNGVKVIIRLRPCNQKEESEDTTQIVEKISSDSLWLADQNFTFDYVAGQDSSQQSIYEIVGQPLVENCLQGFNSSIFAYGQTGSGKTFTMWGTTQDLMVQPPSEERGLTPRVFECLFQRIDEEEKKNADKQLRYQCRCSFFEIYNEQITDLLEPTQKALQVREDTKTGVYVENLTEEFVSSVSDVFRLMIKGLGNRKVASTSMNVESSRSHTLFTCVIESRCKSMSDGVSSVRTSRMNLVDLAGSERQKSTGAAGDRLKEAGNINRSLSQLGNLINILAEVSQSGKPRHIPYRDSRLTFLLQESLGGNAKLAMICAISPASSCKSETLSTLRFAQRAKSIQNKAVVNEETEDDVKILREQIRQLKDELMRMKSNDTVPGASGSYSNGWNARRSYNLLRMSLNRPMTLPHTDTDTDEEMEIDEDTIECADDMATPSAQKDNLVKTSLEVIAVDEELQTGIHVSDTEVPSTQILDEDVVLEDSVKAPIENASVASSLTVLVDYGRNGGQTKTEGHHEEIKSGELLAQECSLQSQPNTQAENMNIHENDLDVNPVNFDRPSCLDEMLAPTMQGISDVSGQGQGNVPALEESHTNVEDNSVLETECETCEKPASSDVNLFSFHLDPLLQAENDGVCGLAESPLQACLSIEPEHKAYECTSDDKEAELQSCISEGKCQNSPQMEPLLKSGPDEMLFQKFDPATPGVTIRLSVSDDFGSVTMSTDFHDAYPQPHYLEDLSIPDPFGLQCQQARADVVHSWVSNDNLQQDVKADEAHGGGEDLVEGDSRISKTPETDQVLKSPVLSISPHLAMASLDAPILSISPRLVQDRRSKSFCTSPVPVTGEDASVEACRMSCEEFDDAEADTQLQKNISTAPLGEPVVNSNTRSSQNLSSPTDRLAASLHRGLQIIENHQKKVSSTRMSKVRFSFQNPEWDKPKLSSTVSKSVQTSPVCFLKTSSEGLETMQFNTLPMEQVCESSKIDHVSMEDASTPQKKSDLQSIQNMEAVLAGALRRERATEEDLNRKNAEIEQLNRLVRQYKHERECNAVIQQSLEDKIARLESLMDGTLPTDSFLNEEWSSLLNEHKMLQKRYDHHPEVTLANIRQQRLCEDIEKYKSFCELGERDALLKEVSQLRNQLQYYVELDTARPAKQRQRSLTPQAKSSASDDHAACESTVSDNVQTQEDNSNPVTGSEGCQMCEKEAAQWMERENDWMLVLEELRAEVEEYKQLAEKRKHEVGGQQRCADEMKEALQIAMEGHARLLDQYAELQEKHISLLAKHRKIKDAMSNARKRAGKLGFLGCGKWFEAQAAELIAVKLEREQERKAAKEQIEGLQAQLRDTADAVQAAGELLVRLKEAEEATLIAQDAAALAEQDAGRLYRVIDKLKRRHSTEIATLQQRLLESRFQKSSLCPMCVMAERVKFEFTGVDDEEAEAALEAQHLAAQAVKDQDAARSHGSLPILREESAEEPGYEDLYMMRGLDNFHASEADERWYDDAQTCNI